MCDIGPRSFLELTRDERAIWFSWSKYESVDSIERHGFKFSIVSSYVTVKWSTSNF